MYITYKIKYINMYPEITYSFFRMRIYTRMRICSFLRAMTARICTNIYRAMTARICTNIFLFSNADSLHKIMDPRTHTHPNPRSHSHTRSFDTCAGKMHNYLRMYWAKQVCLQYSVALESCVVLSSELPCLTNAWICVTLIHPRLKPVYETCHTELYISYKLKHVTLIRMYV